MNNFQKGKKVYDAIKIPEELNYKIEKSLRKKSQKKKAILWLRPALSIAMSFVLLFVLMLNVSPTFASKIADIPVVGNIAKLLTVKQYSKIDDKQNITVKMPGLTNTGNSELENKINTKITERVNTLLGESKVTAEELKRERDKNGVKGTLKDLVNVRIDYEIKYNRENKLSFILYKEESMGNGYYKEDYTYTVNLETGEDITLQQLLGDNYIELCNRQIVKQIKERQKDSNQIFFTEGDDSLIGENLSFKTIDKDQKFYLNEKGNVVIIFDKYAIAPGYMGIPEFEIQK